MATGRIRASLGDGGARRPHDERITMYTDVIIGFDGSDSGRDALALGHRLARSIAVSTTVVCVHGYQALTADVEMDAAVELSWRRHAERVLDEARATLDAVHDV